MDQNLELAIEAARKAGEYLIKAQSSGKILLDWKNQGKATEEPVNRFDRGSQSMIQDTLSASGLPFWGEESEKSGTLNGWIVDPIDGTSSFAKGNKEWGISIALLEKGASRLGVVYLPRFRQIFWAQKHERVWRQEQFGLKTKINPKPFRLLNKSRGSDERLRILLDVPFDQNQREKLSYALSSIADLQASQSSVCHVVEVLTGNLDAYLQAKEENIFDIAASHFIARETGATVSSIAGEPLDLKGGNILITRHALISQRIIERISERK